MVTPHAERYRFSPVNVMSLYGMADSKPRSAVRHLTLAIPHMLPSAFLTTSAHWFNLPFVANMPYDPTI